MTRFLSIIIGCAALAAAQQISESDIATQVTVENKVTGAEASSDYVLGPGDQIRISALHIEELPKEAIAIGADGSVSLPYVGRIMLAGRNAAQAEAELDRAYREYLIKPDISVSVVEFQSQPVSVLGAVKTPGVQQVQGKRTLVEVLSMAGGLTERAGSRLKVTRRVSAGPLPLPDATQDSTGEFYVAEVNLKDLYDAQRPAENIVVKPNDVLSVPVADTIYVMGHVLKAGGYMVDQQERMTALSALSMAGGMDNVAQPKHARIIRRASGQLDSQQIEVNLAEVMKGEAPDVPMKAEDILYIPNNAPKQVAMKALEVAVQMGVGVVIWGLW